MVRFLQRTYVFLVFTFLYAPIAVLIVLSFNAARSRGVWGGFTLQWYVELFQDRVIMSSLYTHLVYRCCQCSGCYRNRHCRCDRYTQQPGLAAQTGDEPHVHSGSQSGNRHRHFPDDSVCLCQDAVWLCDFAVVPYYV